MAYREPNVTVTQVFQNNAVNTNLPQRAACIIGPGYQMQNEVAAGTYDGESGVAQDFAFPGLLAGTVVDIRKDVDVIDELPHPVQVHFEDARVNLYEPTPGDYSNGSIANASNTLNVTGSPFTFDLTNAHYVRLLTGKYRHDLGTQSFNVVLTGAGVGYIDLIEPLAYANDFRAGNPTVLHVTVGGVGTDYTIDSVDAALNRINLSGLPGVGFSTDAGTETYVHQPLAGALEASETAIRRITSVVDVHNVRVTGILYNVSYSELSFDVLEVKDFVVDRNDFETVLPAPITIDETGVEIPVDVLTGIVDPDMTGTVESASIRLTFRALRTTLAGTLIEVQDGTDIAASIGTVDEPNTGAYATNLAVLNSNGVPVYFTGVGEDFFSTDTTTRTAAFQEALDFLEQKQVYALAVTSMSSSIHQIVNTHVNAMSDPEIGMWRVAHNSLWIVTVSAVTNGTTGHAFVGPRYEGISATHLDDIAGTFVTSSVEAEDRVVVNSFIREPQRVGAVIALTGAPVTVTLDSIGSLQRNAILRFAGASANIAEYTPLVGRNLKITTGTCTLTLADANSYRDADRPIALTGIPFSLMGYRCRAAVVDGADVLVTLEYISTDLETSFAVPQTIREIEAWDSILTAAQEASLLDKDGHEITSVENETSLTLTSAIMPTGFTGRYVDVAYSIVRPMTKTEQAEYMAAYARSYDNRRIRFDWPDEYRTEDGTVLPGYFLCAARVGWISGNPAQQGMTNSYMNGFYGLNHSNKHFTLRSEMNALAGGGVEIFTQDVDNANILCRHQLTSDMDTVYYQEASITHAVDMASYMYKNQLKSLIGKNNITQDLFSTIATRAEGIKSILTDNPTPGIGATLSDVQLIGLGRSSVNIDRVWVKIRCVPNVPCNGIDVYLYIE